MFRQGQANGRDDLRTAIRKLYRGLEGVVWMLARLEDRIQTLWRKGTVQRFDLSQYVDHSFNAALLIGLAVRFRKISDAGPKSKRCPSHHSPAQPPPPL